MNKMKAVLLVLIFALPLIALADLDTHGRPLDEVVAGIMESQEVSIIADIECDKVTEEEFNELGEVFMGIMHPDPELHEQMDNMMGGESSETLKSAHSNMGKSYLGCSSTAIGMEGVGSGIMNGGMMGGMGMISMMGGGNAMMRSFGLRWIGMILFWSLIIIGIIVFITWLVRYNQGGITHESVLDILEKRYAKGEIKKEQFEEMKKNIKNK